MARNTHSIAAFSFENVRPMINAMKANDLEALLKYEDLVPVDLGSEIKRLLDLRKKDLIGSYMQNRLLSKAHSEDTLEPTENDEGIVETETQAKNENKGKRVSKRKQKVIEPDGFLDLFDRAQNAGISVYEMFKRAGYIKHVSEFFDTPYGIE